MSFLALRPRLGRWLLLALMCMLPLQSLYAATAVQPAPVLTHATSEAKQGHDCHADSGTVSKSQCDTVHCAACTPPIVVQQAPALPALTPIRVAAVSPSTLDIVSAPARKPPRH
ncbi:hypothetical protein R0381_002317 [Jeongeupia wiesaeckerbachi]|uniref:hypothetical protein n=1 Tax=Jeongeupia wiesaeckerbachi TaxID=3051218 RepID=UPI003D804540